MPKQIFHKDLYIIILVNILFVDYIWLCSIIAVLLFIYLDDVLKSIILFNLTLIFLIMRFIILPFTYNFMEHNSNNLIVQRFIFKIRNNIMTKIIILFLSFLPTLTYYKFHCENLIEFTYSIPSAIVMSISCGAFGSYIFLFLYWYLKDKFNENHLVNKLLNIIINKYTCIISILLIILGYFLIILLVFMSK